MKKIISFVIVLCMAMTLCTPCLAAKDLDSLADAKAKFAALSKEEQDRLYKLADETIESVIELLREYSAAGIIEGRTYEMVVDIIMSRSEKAKEEGTLPVFPPPPPPFQPED